MQKMGWFGVVRWHSRLSLIGGVDSRLRPGPVLPSELV